MGGFLKKLFGTTDTFLRNERQENCPHDKTTFKKIKGIFYYRCLQCGYTWEESEK